MITVQEFHKQDGGQIFITVHGPNQRPSYCAFMKNHSQNTPLMGRMILYVTLWMPPYIGCVEPFLYMEGSVKEYHRGLYTG